MSSSFNKVILMGNLTRDPEVKTLQSGTAVANFGLAVNEQYRTKNGDKKENTTFVDIEVWRRQAENCGEYLSKGSAVLIDGKLKLDQWQNSEGQKRSKHKVTAMSVQFLPKGEKRQPKDDEGGEYTVKTPEVRSKDDDKESPF